MFLISFTAEHTIAIVLAAIAMQVVGMAWYSRSFGFGKRWSVLVGMPIDSNMSAEMKKSMMKSMIVGFVLSVLISTGLATLLNVFILLTVFDAIKVALLVAVLLSGASSAMNYLYNPNLSLKLFAIDIGYHILSIVVSAVVLFFFL